MSKPTIINLDNELENLKAIIKDLFNSAKIPNWGNKKINISLDELEHSDNVLFSSRILKQPVNHKYARLAFFDLVYKEVQQQIFDNKIDQDTAKNIRKNFSGTILGMSFSTLKEKMDSQREQINKSLGKINTFKALIKKYADEGILQNFGLSSELTPENISNFDYKPEIKAKRMPKTLKLAANKPLYLASKSLKLEAQSGSPLFYAMEDLRAGIGKLESDKLQADNEVAQLKPFLETRKTVEDYLKSVNNYSETQNLKKEKKELETQTEELRRLRSFLMRSCKTELEMIVTVAKLEKKSKGFKFLKSIKNAKHEKEQIEYAFNLLVKHLIKQGYAINKPLKESTLYQNIESFWIDFNKVTKQVEERYVFVNNQIENGISAKDEALSALKEITFTRDNPYSAQLARVDWTNISSAEKSLAVFDSAQRRLEEINPEPIAKSIETLTSIEKDFVQIRNLAQEVKPLLAEQEILQQMSDMFSGNSIAAKLKKGQAKVYQLDNAHKINNQQPDIPLRA